jgi:hypothetical protein
VMPTEMMTAAMATHMVTVVTSSVMSAMRARLCR